jgi:hypothetical protein
MWASADGRRRTSASAVIAAQPSRVYAILMDYREEHPLILPSRYFRGLEIEAGGIGAGTRMRVTMRVLGATRTFRQVVTEPEPGRVLVETDVDGANVTTFTVDPHDDGESSRVTIETEFAPRRGVLGFVEGVLTARMLAEIYRDELALLAKRVAVGSERHARSVIQ